MSRDGTGDRVRSVEDRFAAAGLLFAALWHPDYFHFALCASGEESVEAAYDATHRP